MTLRSAAMLLGYNTNGFAHHRLEDALQLLAEIGYRSVAITLDHHALNPYHPEHEAELARIAEQLQRCQLRSVIETGARFLLDPRRKHEPTLLHPDPVQRARRIDFLCRAVTAAHALGSDGVSLWSGVLRDQASSDEAWTRLVTSLQPVVERAEKLGVPLGFEPEPGMFIDTLQQFERLLDQPRMAGLRLTLDVGHLHCLGEIPIPAYIRRWRSHLVNVHIEDMRRGVHEHLMFGEGEMDFEQILQALDAVDYCGGVHVELSRHSHEAPEAAQRAFAFLSARLPTSRRQGIDDRPGCSENAS